ncbi:MAG: hypothetical protein Kow0077_29720 [Anaerolineae bacterium]
MPRPWFDHFRFVAPIYERVFDSDGADTRALREMLALPVDGLLLDAGGGTGRVSRQVADAVQGVVVLDASRGMLTRVRGGNSVWPALGVAEALPFPDGLFARILIVDAFHHFYEHQQAVRELWRVLAPGGRLVILEPNIERWQIKLIALAETVLLMRSRFYSAPALEALFARQENARVAADVDSNPYQFTLVVEKLDQGSSGAA